MAFLSENVYAGSFKLRMMITSIEVYTNFHCSFGDLDRNISKSQWDQKKAKVQAVFFSVSSYPIKFMYSSCIHRHDRLSLPFMNWVHVYI